MTNITIEIYYLVLTSGFTGVIWLSYLFNRIKEIGVTASLGYPSQGFKANSQWASRLKMAHKNAVENLAVFMALVIAIEITELNNSITALASMAYFYARVVHAVVYGLGIPVLRTLAFMVGFVCQCVLFWQFF